MVFFADSQSCSSTVSTQKFHKRVGRVASPLARKHPRALVEDLESRVLLSVSHVVKHSYVIQHAAGRRPAAVSAPTGITPAQMSQAYGFNQVEFGSVAGDGSNQTIAIVDAYNAPNIVSDLHAFDVQFGLPDPTLTRLNESGGTTMPRNDPAGRGNSWAVETSLDVEWAHAMAPKATIVLVLASSANDSDLMAAVNTARNYAGVSAVSMSWGGDESSSDPGSNSAFTTPAGHTGVTFIASSGDSGAYGSNGRTAIVGYPAASPNVVAVGGTTLSIDSAGDYLGESGWGNGTQSANLGGSGGGISRYEAQPSYQRGVVTQSSTNRGVPDIAFDADPNSGVPVFDSYDFGSGGWVQVGGTSLSAPLFAGVIAIANQGRTLADLGTLDGPSQTLPMLYALSSGDFHDITTGNNGYAAGPGYDLVTGRGTPIVNKLVADLVGNSAPTQPAPTPSIGSFSVNPTSVLAGANVTLTASGVTETGGTISGVTFYLESNGTSGLQTSADTLIGAGSPSGSTWTFFAATTGLTPGNYTYYAVATDASGVTSTVASATLTIATPQSPASSNDNFANGAVITGTSISVTGSNVNATKEPGEPNHAGNSGGKSVWWTWTAPSSGLVQLNTAGSNFDTLLAVYTGTSVSSLTRVASDDDVSFFNLTSALTFGAVAGQTYHIAVDGYRAASGNIDLNLSEQVAPANDNFANAIALSSSTVNWTGNNLGASREANDPFIAGNSGGSSVWLTWTAPTTRTVTLTTLGSSFDTLLGVYTGNSLSSLSLIASNDDAVPGRVLSSSLSFNAIAGTTYRIDIDGYNGAQGNIVLNFS